MQNVGNAKSAICIYCVLDVLHIFLRDRIQTSVDRGVYLKPTKLDKGAMKKVSFWSDVFDE